MHLSGIAAHSGRSRSRQASTAVGALRQDRSASAGALFGLLAAAAVSVSLAAGPDIARALSALPAALGGAAPSYGAPTRAAPVQLFEPGEILAMAPSKAALADLTGAGLRVGERVVLSGLGLEVYRLSLPAELSVPAALARFRDQLPGVALEANHLYLPAGAGPLGAESRVRADSGWGPATESCGAGLRLGVIDSPVDIDHPALAGQRIAYRSFHNPARELAAADHGTAVSAMLVGKASEAGWGGILPGAELRAANIFELNEKGDLVGNAVGLLKALDWMAAEEVDVVNLSVAGSDNAFLRQALQRAHSRGLIAVAAAGNWGREDRPAYPAAYEQVIAVTAFDAERRPYRLANRGSYIDFAAPGVQVWTAVPNGGRLQSGTSFAVPYVSAHIAAAAAGGLGRRCRGAAPGLERPGRRHGRAWQGRGLRLGLPRRRAGLRRLTGGLRLDHFLQSRERSVGEAEGLEVAHRVGEVVDAAAAAAAALEARSAGAPAGRAGRRIDDGLRSTTKPAACTGPSGERTVSQRGM